MAAQYIQPQGTPTLRDRISALFSPAERKEGLPMPGLSGGNMNAWWGGAEDATWEGASFQNFVRLAYKQNSAVFGCIQALATGFAEAPIGVYDADTQEKVQYGKDQTATSIYDLFRYPNPNMGEKELWLYLMTYVPLGGNGFLYKARSKANMVQQLWPYHFGKMRPVPMHGDNPENWIASFSYDLGGGQYRYIDTEDVLHVKWMPDPHAPYLGQSPIEPVWREILTDNELTRFIKGLVQNDATPRGLLTVPAGMAGLNKQAKQDLKMNWKRMFGGNNSGDIAIMEGGLTYNRVALSMQELQTEMIRKVPEARIAMAFKVPPVVAHLNVGLDKSTYSNYEEARQQFTEETLVPLWDLVASVLNQDLMPDLDPQGRFYLAFDTSKVQSLKENVNDKSTWVLGGYSAGILTLNQALTLLGEATDDTPNGDLRLQVPGSPGVPAHAPVPSFGGPPAPAPDATDNPLDNPEVAKGLQRYLQMKAKKDEAQKKIEDGIAADAQSKLEAMYAKVAEKVGG